MTTLLESQAYWDRQPCNIRHSPKEVGTKEYFDEVEARKYFVEPHIVDFAEFPKWHGKSVMEIGCGIGTDAVNFARAGAHYTGIDFSPVSLELARKRFEVYGLTGKFYLADAEDFSWILPLMRFDLVYSFGVIHHCQHPERVVEGLKAYMGPDSELRLMLYARPSWKAIMMEAGLEQSEAQDGCPIVHTYTRERATELLKDFNILEMRQEHIFRYAVSHYVEHRYVLQSWVAVMPPNMFRALETNLGWHLLIRCSKR